MRFILLILFILLSLNAFSFPIPKDNKAVFDITRKNKIIGTHEIIFIKNGNEVNLETTIDIEVKVLFIPAYKFYHKSTEMWLNDNFIKIDGYTDFEDEREYFIKGIVTKDDFEGTGMDGDMLLDRNIIPSNLWNVEILQKKILFDTQKGITRSVKVRKLKNEEIIIDNKKIQCKKYSFIASSHLKDKGPFPEYTLWYDEKNELIKYQFTNYKDKKDIIVIRNYQSIN